MQIKWMSGKAGITLGYTKQPPGEEISKGEADRPEFVIKPMTLPPRFTLYHNDYNLGPYLFLEDLGSHPTLEEAKEAAENTATT